ncbi:hypothetical protein WA026_019216 [Henosepilachna vigintioctopunctata]|uniref:Uncharacterized protein n=1 Tax=Henosepilachna vigintioctopunctata TaxID=420089 RepID=A0AAW1UVU5_9CUCU
MNLSNHSLVSKKKCEVTNRSMEAEGERECSEDGYLLVRIHVPELNVQKCLQFPRDQLVWDVKQQCLAALPKIPWTSDLFMKEKLGWKLKWQKNKFLKYFHWIYEYEFVLYYMKSCKNMTLKVRSSSLIGVWIETNTLERASDKSWSVGTKYIRKTDA